ncbi:MAG: hypothetical protein CMJ58_28680 [Planctomycetaceae bacterium]|nr:hypothetical protein [Planctomycetaceae bacterium]
MDDHADLFDVLGIHDPGDYDIDGVERAWFDARIAAQNSGAVVHKSIQEAYEYLTADSEEAEALIAALTGPDYAYDDPSQLVLHRLLVAIARGNHRVTARDAEMGAALIRHAHFGLLAVFVHEHNPYSYAITEGYCPADEFVSVDQAGPPLKHGRPRFPAESLPAIFIGPLTLLQHAREFLVDLFLFRWLRTSDNVHLAGKILILAFVCWYAWQGVETLIERSDVWEDRWVSDEIMDGTDNAEEVLRVVRGRFRDIEREGEAAFGWDDWWKQSPTPEIAFELNAGNADRRELYITIRSRTRELADRIESITPNLDGIAHRARSTKSREGVYRANRVRDEARQIMIDLQGVRDDLLAYQSLY